MRNRTIRVLFQFIITTSVFLVIAAPASSQDQGFASGQHAINAASQKNLFAFVMFYRIDDEKTFAMRKTITQTVSNRSDAVLVSIHITDPNESVLVQRFNATHIPMPAVAVVAPNGAICRVLPIEVSSDQLAACIVSPCQAQCLHALQSDKVVALCVQPTSRTEIPIAVRQLQADDRYKDRMQIVSTLANDPGEAKFMNQLRVPTNRYTPMIALMAPPGVMLGVYDGGVTYRMLSDKLSSVRSASQHPHTSVRHSEGFRQTIRR